MLTKIREKVAGPIGLTILGVIALSFVFFGASLNFASNPYAAKVDGSEISVGQFESMYRTQLDRNPSLATLPAEFRVQYRQQVLESLIRDRLVELHMADAGYQISDAQLEEFIQSFPEFQIDGVFDLETAESVLLTRTSYTIAQFRLVQRSQLRTEQLQRAIGGTALVTPSEYRRYLNLLAEQRLVTVAQFDVVSAAAEVEVTEEGIAAFYTENDSLYLLPESVTIEYIELDRAALAESVDVSEEVLQEYYLDSQSRYLRDEQRQARHILVLFGDDEVAAEASAQALLDRINAGESFEALAAEHSEDGGTAQSGGDMGVLTRSQLDGELASTVFTMQEGELNGPVKSEFGFHIVRLDAILEQGPLPLDQVRAELLAELRESETEGAFRDLTRQASDALFDNPDMQAIASAVGLEVQTAADVQRTSAGPFGSNQAAIDAIFDQRVLIDGDVSEVIEIDASRSAIFKVLEHAEASRQPLADVHAQVEVAIRSREAATIIFDRASQLMQALDSGEVFSAAADAGGALVSAPALVGRQSEGVDQTVLAAIFAARKPSQDAPVYGQVANEAGGYTVFSLQAVLPGDPLSIPQADRFAGKDQLALQAGGADYLAFVQSLYDDADIVINSDILAASDLLQ
jgi:peptidyl-prolyl cis-trans isomerase D